MHLETWAEISLLIFGGLFSLVTVGILVAIAFAVNKLAGLLEKGLDKVDPVIVKTTSALDTVQRVTTNIGVKADQVLVKGEALTDDVSGRVEKTAGVVQSAVIKPLIDVSSIISGISKGFQVYTHPGTSHHTQAANGVNAKQYQTSDQEQEARVITKSASGSGGKAVSGRQQGHG